MENRVFIRDDVLKQRPNGISLVAYKCTSCGKVAFPKTDYCLACYNKDMKEIELSRKGELYSYTITHYPSAKFKAPHATGLIDMPEGVRIYAPLVMDEKGFKIGREMEWVIDTLWTEEDKEVIGYKFKQV
jgi:uncharacterized OB-fold protein